MGRVGVAKVGSPMDSMRKEAAWCAPGRASVWTVTELGARRGGGVEGLSQHWWGLRRK